MKNVTDFRKTVERGVDPHLTLCLDQLPLKSQFTKEKRTLKTLVLSRESNTLPQYISSCKEQATSDKNLSVKPYSLISCYFKHNL